MTRLKNYWDSINWIPFLKELPHKYEKSWKKKRCWLFLCKCWKEFPARIADVVAKKTKSCWCYLSKLLQHRNTKHWMSNHRVYEVWTNMRIRCGNTAFKNYWAKWITVCKRREKFENFREDMKAWYQDHLTIDRIDNSLGYYKENCRRATRKQQGGNTSRNILYQWICMAERCRKLWLKYDAVKHQVYYNNIPLPEVLGLL